METQSTVQLKPSGKITIPPNGQVIIDGAQTSEDQYDNDQYDMDDFEFAKIFTPQLNMELTPVASAEMSDKIDQLMAKGRTLSSLNDRYVDTFIVKGNDELYELLGSIYGFMLTVNDSPFRDHILKRMRENLLDAYEIKLQDNATIEATVVRYIVPKDRQTAFNYARVLKVAFIENTAAKDLPGYIKGRGGISKVQDTLVNEAAALEEGKAVKRKLSLYKKILAAKTKIPNNPISIKKGKLLNLVPYAAKPAMYSFAVMGNCGGEDYIVHQVVLLPYAVGEQWLNYISNASIASNDLDAAQDKLDQMRAKLGITSGYGMEPGDKGYQPLVMTPKDSETAEEVAPTTAVIDDSNDFETPEEAAERVALEHP
ncbi:MAG: hypothetical protein NTW57_04865 [Methylophilales bacterium]|nr:hypothetical protein [Methylophilales bacterium]